MLPFLFQKYLNRKFRNLKYSFSPDYHLWNCCWWLHHLVAKTPSKGTIHSLLHTKIKANRPLIDFDTAFMMEPMTLLGSILGVYMNIVFPTYLLIVFLVLVLGYNAYKTLGKVTNSTHDSRRKKTPF